MSKWKDSTIIQGADGTTARPVAVDADGSIVIAASGSATGPATETTMRNVLFALESILTETRVQNRYLLKIVGESNRVTADDVEVRP